MPIANCPECGATDVACEIRFNEFLILEFTDPGFGEVHHLTVATYMLQHSSKLTRQGWLQMRDLLKGFLLEKKPPAFVRKQNRDLVDSGKRAFKITSSTGRPVIIGIKWTKTILDVSSENSEIYCRAVNDWALSSLNDVQKIEV